MKKLKHKMAVASTHYSGCVHQMHFNIDDEAYKAIQDIKGFGFTYKKLLYMGLMEANALIDGYRKISDRMGGFLCYIVNTGNSYKLMNLPKNYTRFTPIFLYRLVKISNNKYKIRYKLSSFKQSYSTEFYLSEIDLVIIEAFSKKGWTKRKVITPIEEVNKTLIKMSKN